MNQPNKILPPTEFNPHAGQIAKSKIMADERMEVSLLGSVLRYPATIEQAIERNLQPDHFWKISHAWVFEAMLSLHSDDLEIDVDTVAARLRSAGHLDDIGGSLFLIKLMKDAPMMASVAANAAEIYHFAWRRKIITYSSEMGMKAQDETISVRDLESRFADIAQEMRLPSSKRSELLGVNAASEYDRILEDRKRRKAIYPTPWKSLNKHVAGISKGSLIVLGGLSGSGKTAMCEGWAEFYATEEGLKVCYAHSEVKRETMLDRRAARYSGVSYSHLLTPDRLTPGERQCLDEARQYISLWEKYIDLKFIECDPAEPEFMNARGLITYFAQKAREGTEVFVVDYFQDIVVDTSKSSEPEARRNFLYALRRFAENTQTIVIVASQMTETAFGVRTYGTRAMDQKAMLMMNITSQPLKSDYRYGDQVLEAGKRSPEYLVKLVKNTFGPADAEFLHFLDGARFWWRDMEDVEHMIDRGSVI